MIGVRADGRKELVALTDGCKYEKCCRVRHRSHLANRALFVETGQLDIDKLQSADRRTLARLVLSPNAGRRTSDIRSNSWRRQLMQNLAHMNGAGFARRACCDHRERYPGGR